MNPLQTKCAVLFVLLGTLLAPSTMAAMGDEPVLTTLMLNELEIADSGNSPVAWDAQLWLGTALNKLWLKTEGKSLAGKTEDFEFQALYSKAISPFWDVQMGLRHVEKPGPQSDWAVIGLQGLSRYFFELDAALFIGDSGDTAFRFNGEYEVLFTQRLILTPEVELNFYGQDNALTGVGSGLSDISAGLRLRYEIRRKIAPYIGLSWQKKVGATAHYAKLSGEAREESNVVLGFRGWF